jgi:hypothetical protein
MTRRDPIDVKMNKLKLVNDERRLSCVRLICLYLTLIEQNTTIICHHESNMRESLAFDGSNSTVNKYQLKFVLLDCLYHMETMNMHCFYVLSLVVDRCQP